MRNLVQFCRKKFLAQFHNTCAILGDLIPGFDCDFEWWREQSDMRCEHKHVQRPLPMRGSLKVSSMSAKGKQNTLEG